MSIILRNLLKQITHDEIVCIAGKNGLDARIENVTVIDSPEILDWLKGGELVVSTGYVSYNNSGLLNGLVAGLKEKGAVGLGIKVNRFYRNVPEILVEDGERLDFPIFAISYEMRMSDIMKLVYANFFSDSMNKIEKENLLYQQVTKAIINGENINAATFNISLAMQNPALIIDRDFRLIAFENHEENQIHLEDFLVLSETEPVFSLADAHNLMDYYKETQFKFYEMKLNNGRENIELAVTPIEIDKTLKGFLCIAETVCKISKEEYSILENSTKILAIYLFKQELHNEKCRYGKDSFLNNVLLNPNGDVQMIQHYCDIWGFDYVKKRVCIYFKFEHLLSLPFYQKKEIADTYQKAIKHNSGKCVTYNVPFQDGFLTYQLYGEDTANAVIKADTIETITYVMSCFDGSGIHPKVSVSAIGKNINHIVESFRQAVEEIRLGEVIFPDQKIYYYEDMMVYDLLGNAIPLDHLLSLYNSTVASLDIADRKGDTEYLKTLDVYLENNCNVTKTAQDLHLHRNTMMYRIERIQEILQMDIKNPDIIFNLRLGVRAKRIMKLYNK